MATKFFSTDEQKAQQQRRFQSLSAETDVSGRRSRAAGLQGALDFDPSEAVTQFGQGFVAEATENLEQNVQRIAGESVGRGRLKTGFFQRDAGRLFEDFNRRVSTAIAQQSLEASRLSLANIQGLQRTGADLLGQQIDLLGGAFDRQTAEENAGGGFWKGLATVAGGVGGFLIGGPPGAAAGASVASSAVNA